ncbi:VCBS repeat-containing protein [Streptomyces sp. NPDC005318]|uniref:FG-GAP repeat domain-containing protein n=1 Tax=Streptomyces sp. NPDC005318 TaxID=3157031 RepID=UPI0033BE40FA
MAKFSGLKGTGFISRATVAAITAALVGTTTGAMAADNPQGAAEAAAAAKTYKSAPAPARMAPSSTASASAGAEARNLFAVSGDELYLYIANGSGGYLPREDLGAGYSSIKNGQQADNDGDGVADDLWMWDTAGYLGYASGEGDQGFTVGGGWNIYNKVLSPGNLGGAAAPDMIARDSAGALWLYLGYGNGKLTGRTKVGSGWNIYNQIAGVGDLSGDGKADIVARDTAGVLWLYKGTGDYKAPFSGRTKVGSGWGVYNTVVGVGDLDGDGRSDLIARDSTGALYRYSGTGNAAAPYKARVKIGAGGWNTYRFMF